MQSTVLPTLLDDLAPAERAALLADPSLRDLSAVFGAVPDPRSRHGRRYDLPFLLTCLVAALLCNCNTLAAVGQWCRDHRALLARLFPHQRAHTPTGALFRWLLPRLSVAELEWALAAWVRRTRPLRDRESLALDGKVVRGAGAAGQRAPHLLSVSTHDTQETLVQVRVADKTNEIPVAQALLPYLGIRGRVITADALHTQTDFAQAVLDHGGAYVLTVKGNQPRLYAELEAYFSAAQATGRRVVTHDWRRGRKEERVLDASTRLTAFLARYSGFPRIRQVARVSRTTHDARGTHQEVVYLITCLTPRQADPARLLALLRGHWRIESRHYTRDVTFGEDRSALRSGHAPQIMAALRNLVLTLIHRTGSHAIATARRHFAAHPRHALRLLLPRKRSHR